MAIKPSPVQHYLSSCESYKSNFKCSNFSVTDSGKNDYEVTVEEALHIKFNRPTITKQLFIQGTSFVLSIFSNYAALPVQHEEHFKGSVGILSGNTWLCLQIFRS